MDEVPSGSRSQESSCELFPPVQSQDMICSACLMSDVGQVVDNVLMFLWSGVRSPLSQGNCSGSNYQKSNYMKFTTFTLAFAIIPTLVAFDRPTAAADPNPLPASTPLNREIFVDLQRLHSHREVALKPHYPVAQEVVLTCDAPWEGNVSGYYTFFADDDRFRVYYRGSHYDTAAKKTSHIEVTCYAESKDGIHWVKPKLGIIEFEGSKENNIVWTSLATDRNEGGASHNFTPFKDHNPDCPADAKYKAFGVRNGNGLAAFKSANGVHWSRVQEAPVITDGAFDSQNLAFWDPNKKLYVAYYRDFRNKKVRDIKLATSPDFIQWTKGEYLNYGDAADEQLYTNAIAPYFRAPQIYLGFPTRYQPKTEQVEPILMTSRDGFHFHRWSEPLIPITAPQDRQGNRSNYMASGLLQLPGQDREISLYATEAYYAGPASRVRRFTIRTDGFISLHADAIGEVVTKPVSLNGGTMTLNYTVEPGGELLVELLDSAGKPIPGFTAEDCVPLTGDEIDQAVNWKKGSDLSAVSTGPVQIRFVMKSCDLYAMSFSKQAQ